MADYRLSVNVISRADGKSAVAAAAYRHACRLQDERTGQVCDYSRKGGIAHSEIIAPDQIPDWMRDRAQLWNAVEKIETRKNSQLSREIQLSLPHELTPDQRRDLVRGFVQEQFVDRGMIADVAIHAPNPKGDERNHHAHIMLTMRELTAEGFHSKKSTPTARAWNDKALLEKWREKWAQNQNRELEKRGHESRVDHRSYEAQGADREPSQHLGYVAADMERNGKPSRIGDQNREIANDNRKRAQDHARRVIVTQEADRDRPNLEAWKERKAQEIRDAQELKQLDLSQKHDRQQSRLESQLEERYGTAKATIAAELKSIDRRLEAKGVRKILRTVFGQGRSDQQAREQMQATLKNIEQREREERGRLEKQQNLERKQQAERQNRRREKFDQSAERLKIARERAKAREGTTPRKFGTPVKSSPEAKGSSPSHHTEKQNHRTLEPPESENKPIGAPSLDDKKLTPETSLDKHKGELKKPWESNLFGSSSENSRPWESDLFKRDEGRGRSPTAPSSGSGSKGGGGGKA